MDLKEIAAELYPSMAQHSEGGGERKAPAVGADDADLGTLYSEKSLREMRPPSRERVPEVLPAPERQAWRSAVMTDAELGGSRLDDTIAAAGGVIREFGTPEAVRALEETGAGDHPEVIRVLARAARALREARGGK